MAEGGSLSRSIQQGSDADFEFPCTPCLNDGCRKEATKYCSECGENLCTTCTKYHLRVTATRSHQLTDPIKQKGSNAKPIPKAKCSMHQGREIELYCGSHDMVYCALCVAKDHRSCTGVCEVTEAAKNRNSNHPSLQDKIDNLHSELAVAKEKKSGNIRRLETEKRDCLSKLKCTGDIIISKVKTLMNEASTDIEQTFSKIEEELRADDLAISTAVEDLDKCKDQVNSTRNQDQTQLFVQEKMQTYLLSSIENTIKSMKQKTSKKMTYVENDELRFQITTAAFLAKIEEKQFDDSPRKKPLKINSKKKKNVRESDDARASNITGICQLPDGTIILADYDNNRIKRLDNNYNVRDHCVISGRPTEICCTGASEVAVKVSGKIVFVQVADCMSISTSFKIDGEGFFGISFYKDEFWVRTGRGINIYSKTGTFLKSLDNDFLKTFSKSSTKVYPAGVDNSTIFLSDCDKTVVCLDENGTASQVLSDERLENVISVCVYTDGTLFLAGRYSCNVLMFSRDGTCLGELLRDEENLSYLSGMCFDSKRKRLLVGGYSNNLLVLKLVG